MSGHSKWANIKVKKGKTDALRGKIFTKIGREIAIAVREGGSNPESNSFEVTTDPNDFSAVREKLEAQGLSFLSAEVQMIPQNTVVPADEDTLQKVQKLLEMLEDNDDVQNVWHNAELPEEPDEE